MLSLAIRSADRELADLGRRDAAIAGLADAASVLVTGLTTIAVLAAAVAAHDSGTLDRVLARDARAARALHLRGGAAVAGRRA